MSQGDPAATSNLVIFDWDNLLCPTHWWLKSSWDVIFVTEFMEKLAEESDALLSEISAVALELLTLAMALAEVKIFADHAWPWVQDSNAHVLRIPESTLFHAEVTHLPELLTEEDMCKGHKLLPVLANLRGVERALRERRKEVGSVWSNIVCISAASAQQNAVQKAMKQLSKRGIGVKYKIKSIKLIEKPSLAELLGQLRLLSLWLPKILALDESVHIRFEAGHEHISAVHERFRPDEALEPEPRETRPFESGDLREEGHCASLGRLNSEEPRKSLTGRSTKPGVHVLYVQDL